MEGVHNLAYKIAKDKLTLILSNNVCIEGLVPYRDSARKSFINALSDVRYNDEIKVEAYKLLWLWLEDIVEENNYYNIEIE